MTVCIVARCREGDSFVAGGDRLFSYRTGNRYDSVSLKRDVLSWDGRWHAMFAANDIAHVLPVVRRVQRSLVRYRPPHRLETVKRACVEAYQAHLTQIINDTILSRYGIDLATYCQEGLNFGADECARIINALKIQS